MILETFPVGPLHCNCTILGDEETREAIVIDPGDEIGRIARRLNASGLKLKRLTGAPILLNESDLPLLAMMDQQTAWIGGGPVPETAPPDESLDDGLVVGLEHYPAHVLHTPGHTQGSICLHFVPLKMVIAGDTLFAGSIGRTDLPGGDSYQILDSIHTRLLALPDETNVVPGHGPSTTIGAERRRNPFLS